MRRWNKRATKRASEAARLGWAITLGRIWEGWGEKESFVRLTPSPCSLFFAHPPGTVSFPSCKFLFSHSLPVSQNACYHLAFRTYGGSVAEWFRALVSGGPGFKGFTLSQRDLFIGTGVPSSNPRSCLVNSQLDCLLPVRIFNYVTFISFLCFSGMPVN